MWCAPGAHPVEALRAGSRALPAWVKVPACKNTILPNFGVSWGCVSCVFQQDVRAKIDANPSAPRPAAALAFLMSNRDNHHLAGRAKQRTRPAAAFCCPGEFGAHSGWVCELARSSARSTPREGARHKDPGGPWSAAAKRDTPSTGYSHRGPHATSTKQERGDAQLLGAGHRGPHEGNTLTRCGTTLQKYYLSQIRRPRCRDYSGPSSQTTTEPTKMQIFEFKATRPNSRFLSIFVGSVVVYDGER